MKLTATVVLAAGLFADPVSAVTMFNITELPTLGGTDSYGYALNDAGVVVGYSKTIAGVYHATKWTSSTTVDLGTLGGSSSYAYAINASGRVAGVSDTSGNGDFHAVTWSGRAIKDLNDLYGGRSSVAFGIDNKGEIVGRDGDIRARLWAAPNSAASAGTRDLSSGQGYGIAYDINNKGQAVGENGQAVVWENGVTRNLGGHAALAINDLGAVVGYGDTTSGSTALLWNGGATTDLGSLTSYSSIGTGINRRGQVVGYIYGAGFMHAGLWSDGGFYDLNSLIDPQSGWLLSAAFAINTSGQIVGYGDSRNGRRGFLLTPIRPVLQPSVTPVPEPSQWLLFIFGLGLAGVVARLNRTALRFDPGAPQKTESRWTIPLPRIDRLRTLFQICARRSGGL